MDIKVYSVADVSDEKIDQLLDGRESFILTQVQHQKETLRALKQRLGKQGLRCKIYTKGRTLVGAAAIPVLGIGFLALGGIAAHSIKHRKSEYHIAKNPVTKTITVTFHGR